MIPVMTAEQMAAMDRSAIEETGIPGIVLMENAGLGLVRAAKSLLKSVRGKRVLIFCGPGNNGGDGYVVARHLQNAGASVLTVLMSEKDKVKGDARINLHILENMGAPFVLFSGTADLKDQADLSDRTDLIVDALLGTGCRGALKGRYAEAVEWINRCPAPVLAVDMPTGVDSDSGAVAGVAVRADVTATMAAYKRGLCLWPGREYAGEISVVDISMPPDLFQRKKNRFWLTEREDIRTLLPRRAPDVHKNRCGTVAVLAGSQGYTGAAALTAGAVLRGGAGLCYLGIPASLNAVLESKLTEVITWPLDDAGAGYLHSGCLSELMPRLEQRDVVAVGPGLGSHGETADLVHELLRVLKKPMVLDADGLNVCAGATERFAHYQDELVLTPHPGELSRLIGRPAAEITRNRVEITVEFARKWKVHLVTKGNPTLMGTPDGRLFFNSTGNAGMASGGTGDVLTGLIAALLAQGLKTENAVLFGVHLHGLAGDLAAANLTQESLIAGDLLDYLPGAFREVQRHYME